MIFADPTPVFADPPPPPYGGPTGLVAADCARCLAHTLAAPAYAGEVLCGSCRPSPGVPLAWLNERPKYAGGWAPGGLVVQLSPRGVELPRETEARELMRVLRRSAAQHELVAEQPPKPAREALFAARQAGHERADLRYAFAENLAGGRMVESWALRVPGLGYALWINGSAGTARIRRVEGGTRGCSVTELVTVASGGEYRPPPPPVPPGRALCTRCGTEVRIKKDGVPYAHTRTGQGGEGGGTERVACV